MKKLFLIFLIFIGCATGSRKIENGKNYLEEARLFFNYKDYEQAIKSAYKVLDYDYPPESKEEAYYILNESAEEIVFELKDLLYLKDENWIRSKINELKDKYNLKIKFEKIGYEYFLYYDKYFYFKLKKINPKSEFLKLIEDRNLARKFRFVTEPAYRYNLILTTIDNYKNLYSKHHKEIYAPALLLRMADLYFYLYENGVNVKKELGISETKIQEFYKNAYELYKKIKTEYPNSIEAQGLAYVIDNVKLRENPSTKSKVIKRISTGTMVRIIERSEKREAISNMYDYWYKVKLIDGTEGWIFGFYLRTTFIK